MASREFWIQLSPGTGVDMALQRFGFIVKGAGSESRTRPNGAGVRPAPALPSALRFDAGQRLDNLTSL